MTKRHCGVASPLFLGACALYAANRWLVKPHIPGAVFHNWLNDLLLIPCALPPLLLVHCWLGLRQHHGLPAWREVAAHLAGWSLLFEVVGPRWLGLGTADPGDVYAYALGALIASCYWQGERARLRWRVASARHTTPPCPPSGTKVAPLSGAIAAIRSWSLAVVFARPLVFCLPAGVFAARSRKSAR